MGQRYHRNSRTESLGSGNTGTATEVRSAGQADTLIVLVDDDTGSAPASYSLLVEVYDADSDTWFDFNSISANTSESHTMDAVGDKMRTTLTNESAGTNTYRTIPVTYK